MIHNNELSSAGLKDAVNDLPKAIDKIRNPRLALLADEDIEDSDDLQGEGVKNFIPSSIIDIYTRVEVLFGLKLFGNNDTLTEASILIAELYNRSEKQNEKQYRKALFNFHT